MITPRRTPDELASGPTAPRHFDPDVLLTVGEVAGMLKISTAWVRQHSNGRRRPMIASVKLGKCVRFRRDDILAFIRSLERQSE